MGSLLLVASLLCAAPPQTADEDLELAPPLEQLEESRRLRGPAWEWLKALDERIPNDAELGFLGPLIVNTRAAAATLAGGGLVLAGLYALAIPATLFQVICCTVSYCYCSPVMVGGLFVEIFALFALPTALFSWMAVNIAHGMAGRRVSWVGALGVMAGPPLALALMTLLVGHAITWGSIWWFTTQGVVAPRPDPFVAGFVFVAASWLLLTFVKVPVTAALLVGLPIGLGVLALLVGNAHQPSDEDPVDTLVRTYEEAQDTLNPPRR